MLRASMIYRAGRWELANGGQLPVKEGTTAEIKVPTSEITDRAFLERMTARGTIKILDAGQKLRAVVSPKDMIGIDANMQKHLIALQPNRSELGMYQSAGLPEDTRFVEVELGVASDRQKSFPELQDGGLWLVFEGALPKDLISSTIKLPENVTDDPVISLNHAFTVLSEKFEPWRKAHTGSVYERFYYQENDGLWYALSLLRDAGAAEKEQEIAYKLWQDFLKRSSAA